MVTKLKGKTNMKITEVTSKFFDEVSEYLKEEVHIIRQEERKKLETSMSKKDQALKWAENEINKHKKHFTELHTRFEKMQKEFLSNQKALEEILDHNKKLKRRVSNLENFGKGKNEKTKVESAQPKTNQKKTKRTKAKSS